MTTTTLPPDYRTQLRRALRDRAGKWIAANYRHQLLVARSVKGMQVEAVEAFQRDVVAPAVREVAARLATFDDRGPAVTIDRFPELRQLSQEVSAIVARGGATIEERVTRKLTDLAVHEAEWVRDSARKVLRVEPPPIVPTRLAQEALARPFEGQKLGEWFRDTLTQPAAKSAVQWIQTGLNRGLSVDSIAKGLRGTPGQDYLDGWLSGSAKDLRVLVRTAGTHFSATANTEAFKAIGVDRYRWVATLDSRSCPVCGANDGKVWEHGDGPLPPSHPNCRCAVTPAFGDPEGTRASKDGQVPADLTFADWLEGRSAAEQDEVLGKRVGRAYRAGLPLAKTIGADMQVLTLAELRRLDRIQDDPE
ncbi:MAG: minor capsid protein [Planctomycetota bacterium]